MRENKNNNKVLESFLATNLLIVFLDGHCTLSLVSAHFTEFYLGLVIGLTLHSRRLQWILTRTIKDNGGVHSVEKKLEYFVQPRNAYSFKGLVFKLLQYFSSVAATSLLYTSLVILSFTTVILQNIIILGSLNIKFL